MRPIRRERPLSLLSRTARRKSRRRRRRSPRWWRPRPPCVESPRAFASPSSDSGHLSRARVHPPPAPPLIARTSPRTRAGTARLRSRRRRVLFPVRHARSPARA